MKTLSLTLFIAGLSMNIHAQINTGEIQGKVFESKNVPAYSAFIMVNQQGSTVKTLVDDDGRFVLKPLLPGLYQVLIINEGDTVKRNVEVLPNEISRISDIVLSNEIPEVIICGGGPRLRIDQPNVTSITADQIKNMSVARNIVDLISAVNSDVVSINGEAYVRGSRADDILYYVDGVKQTGRVVCPPKASLRNVMVYTGGLPAKYGDTTGGVVLIETKNYFMLYYEWLAKQ